MTLKTSDPSDIGSELCLDKKTKRQKDKKTKRQKDKIKTKRQKKAERQKTKTKKRIQYCDVRAVSHSCDVFTYVNA